ncbi:MAG: methylated-DNA--[protein]-cysteine S-methyltransferase [Muribaculaceae bacterium]|nr:methylated-DNA--[protein]-cysteine S-methyltransferase [Muribaculaceae bacterium]
MHVNTLTYSSPCGKLILGELQGQLVFCDWDPGRNAARVLRLLGLTSFENPVPLLTLAAGQLDEYFCRCRRSFSFPLRLVGTPFRTAVWQALSELEYGTTLSYSSLARLMGLPPSSTRALASAVGANPLSILLPCHRIIGADSSLRGYAGGLDAKKFLLDHEMTFFRD